MHDLGPWADPDAALTKCLKEKAALHAGRTPRPDREAATIEDVANTFLTAMRDKMNAGELSVRTWAKYKEVADMLVSPLRISRLVAALAPDHIAALTDKTTKQWGLLRISDFIQHVRGVFEHASEAGLVPRVAQVGQDNLQRWMATLDRVELERDRAKGHALSEHGAGKARENS